MANEFKIKNGLVVSGSADIEQDLTVRGTITADQFNISIVSSSVMYESGSTKFGNSIDDNHTFTGSVNITGSINLNGQVLGTGKLDETTFNTFTSSVNTYTGNTALTIATLSTTSSLNNLSSSVGSLSSSIATTDNTQNGRLDSLETASGSIRTNFNTFTSSYTTSSFTGSFKGDGGLLYNIPASGVTGLNLTQIADGSVTASVSNTNGLRVNSNSEITGSLTVTGNIIGSVDYDTLRNKPTLVSGSSQILITGTTGYSTFSSSVATTDLNQNNRIGSLEGVSGSYATTGSNLFIGTQTHSGSIVPSVDNLYDLGSTTHQWRDVYISSGSLYIDGTKVISSTAQELTITTDTGQSLKILEGTTDSIVLQTADGDVELKSSGDGDILLDPTNGKILLKGPVEILNGQKIQSSVGGTPVVFANDIVVSGSIDITGTIEGINLTDFSSSVSGKLTSIEGMTSSLSTFTSSASGRLTSIETSTGSLNSFTSSAGGRLTSLEGMSGSLSSFTSSAGGRLTSLESSTSSLNSFTSSATNRLTSIESSTSSFNSFTSSVDTTIKNKLNTESVISSSIQVDITSVTNYSTFSSSIAATDLAQSNKINVLELKTGSYATTGSNIFQGTQTITGSLYISQDLIVAGSSSIQHISSSVLNIADNIITVNAQNPSIRFGGLAVIDSGSTPQVSGSILFDSVENQWIFVHQNQLNVTSSMVIMGPETYNSLGNEIHLTNNRLVKSVNDEHIGDSNISDNGTNVSINSNTNITGSLLVTSTIVSQTTPLVSGSSQISYTGITNIPSGIVSGSGQVISLLPAGTVSGSSQITYGSVSGIPSGIVSGSSQISYTGITNIPSGLVSGSSQVLLSSGIWSGSAQLPSGVVSGSSQVLLSSGIWSGSAQLPSGIVSGAAQLPSGLISGSSQLPSGLVSGSSQVDLTATTNYSSGIKTRLNSEGVISGSSQVLSGTGIWSGSAQLPAGVVSSSLQTIANLPSGTVSGSSQISFGGITGVPGGLVSGSSQVLSGTGIWSGSAQLPSGVVSGSAQTIANLPSGTVSGSSQISLASTTGFGSYLNQAVLTTSTPTFSTVSATTFTGALSGNATSASALNGGGTVTTAPTTNQLFYTGQISSGASGLFTATDNSNSIITLNRHPGNYDSQLGFSSNGNMYYRSFSAAAINTSQAWQTIWTSNSLTNLNQLSNGPGYLTSITSGNVTTALGYTPYNSTNPSGYITSSGNAATATTLISNATVSRDLYINGGTGGNFGNRLLIGTTTATYTLQDGNIRPTIYMNGAYPVLTMNHTATSNTNHGPTIQFTFDGLTTGGSTSRQILIGTPGTGNHLDFGFSGGGFGDNSDYNPHRGIAGYGGVTPMRLFSNGLMVGSNGSYPSIASSISYNFQVNGTGYVSSTFTVGGTFTENSSIRYKKDIETISYGLDKVLQMRGVTYLKKENDIKEVGVIAEEIAEIFPELVNYDTEGRPDSVSYGRITALLIEAIKDLKKEINDLKNNG